MATFEAVVEAAAHILETEGAKGLTTNRIATRAGVSVGSLYQYFPNKEAIVRALMERQLKTAEALRPALLDDLAAPLEARLEALVTWRFGFAARRETLGRTLAALSEKLLSEEELRRLLAMRRRRTARAVNAWLPEQKARDLAQVAMILDAILAAVTELATAENRLTSETFRREIVALLARYLEHPASA